MTTRRTLLGTTNQTTPAADTVKIVIKSMPLIDRAALPGLPDDLEARLFNLPDQEPRILLVHPPSELFVEVSLLDRENLGGYVEALTVARLRQAMGEPPETGKGYRID